MANGLGGQIANAGMSRQISKISPTKKRPFFERLSEGIGAGLEVLSPEFRAAKRLGLQERQVEVQEGGLELRQDERRESGRTIVPKEIFKDLSPKGVALMEDMLRLKGVEISPEGRGNQREITKAFQAAEPEDFQQVFKESINELDGGITNINTQIKNEEEKLAKLKTEAKDTQGTEKRIQELRGIKQLNEDQLNRLSAMSTSLAGEQKATAQTSPFGKIKISDFTPESLEQFKQSGNFSDLVSTEPEEEDEVDKFQSQINKLNQDAASRGVGIVSPITRDDILIATGFTAGSFRFLAKAFGSFIPGEQSPKTQEAINDIDAGNQQIRQAVALSPRFNEGEIKRINSFLVPGGAFFRDPPFALRQYLGLRNLFESNNKQMLDAINRGTVPERQTEEFLEKINLNNIVLNLIPSRENLQSPKIFAQQQANLTLEDVNKMSVDDIKKVPTSGLRLIPREVREEMIRRLEEAKGNTSGSF